MVAKMFYKMQGIVMGMFGNELRLAVVVAAVIVSGVAFCETFTWRSTSTSGSLPASPNWQSFGTAANWAVGTDKAGTNPDGLVPKDGDFIYYGAEVNYVGTVQAFDLDGRSYTVAGLASGMTGWGKHYFLFRNGTIEFSDNFTNRYAQVHVYDAGKIIVGSASGSLCGQSTSLTLIKVYDGGEADIGGNVNVRLMRMEVEPGGAMTFRPKTFAFDASADKDNGVTWLKNSGTLAIPGKLSLTGWSGDRPCVFSIEQNAGTMTLGGNISNGQYGDVFDFILAGGTVNVTNDVKFSNMRTVRMSEDAVVTVNVAAGKTLDLTPMNFGVGTVLTKSGEGTAKFGASVPDILNIDGGVAEPTVAVKFGTVSFAQGGVLHLGITGVSAKKIQGAANATLTASAAVLSSQKPVFLTEDEADAAVLAGKLVPPEGYAVVANGGTLTVEKNHGAAGFVWKYDTSAAFRSFYNPSFWGVGDTADAGNDNGWIPGENDVINHGLVYNQYYCFDMGGGRRWINGLGKCVVYNNTWAPFRIGVSNGTLGIVSNFTNVHAIVTVYNGGCFVLGENCGARMGYDGNASEFTVQSGGECDIGGDIGVNYLKVSVDAGGRFAFHPRSFAYDYSIGGNAVYNSHIRNSGTLELPGGIALGGGSRGGCTFTVEQRSGEMVLGGDVKMLDTVDYLDFNLTGGTVRVTANVSFVGCRSVVMTNDAVAEIAVDSGKVADFSAMVFRDGTTLAKTGGGTLKIGTSAPQSLDVQAGTLAVAGAAEFGEGLSLGAGSTVHFAAGGSSAGVIPGLDDASVTIDPKSVGYGSAIISSTNAALIASVADKLSPAIAAADKPKLFLEIVTQAGDPDVKILRLMRVPKGIVFSFK